MYYSDRAINRWDIISPQRANIGHTVPTVERGHARNCQGEDESGDVFGYDEFWWRDRVQEQSVKSWEIVHEVIGIIHRIIQEC